LTIVTELAAISGMGRERFSGAERKTGTIFVPYDLWNNLRNLCSLLKFGNRKDNQNGLLWLEVGNIINYDFLVCCKLK
jgi:hypothetical protein